MRPEFAHDGIAEMEHVLTTQELARMIAEAGLRFTKLPPESFDMPMGFKTGAGVIFGNSGGVSEAVLRYAYAKVTGKKLMNPDIHAVRGEDGLRIVEAPGDGLTLKLGIVHGLKNARTLAEKARRGKCDLDIIEVMACPGGIGGQNAHRLRHTNYHNRRRIADETIALGNGPAADKVKVNVCTGTNCFLKGSQNIVHDLLEHVQQENLQEQVDVCASFCFEKCDQGPTVSIDGKKIQHCTPAAARTEADEKFIQKKQTMRLNFTRCETPFH